MNDALKKSEIDTFEDELHYAIGDRASTLRRRAGVTLSTCGAIMGVTESSASLKFNGKGKWSAAEVRRMADTFGVGVAVLYGDEPMPEPTRPGTVTAIDTSKNADRPTKDYGSDDWAGFEGNPVADITRRIAIRAHAEQAELQPGDLDDDYMTELGS